LAALHAAQKKGRQTRHIDLISLVLDSKSTADMTKVIKMIDEMVGVLGTEQTDDDNKKAYCEKELDIAEDKSKGFMQMIRDADTAVKDAKETIKTLESEITALIGGLAMMDQAVKEATAQRKKENEAFKVLESSNTMAGALIEKAKKRLKQFYGVQVEVEVTSFLQVRREIPSFLETKRESTQANNVIAMMDALSADLEKETAVAKSEEMNAQADYEKFMADSKQKRIDDSALIEDKEAAKADALGVQQTHEDNMEAALEKLKGSNNQLKVLHKDCDWLLSNYDTRTQARADEVDALKKAKAVLSGADFVQEDSE
jgi:hypothetical protein